ncbi:MAG: M23 family metallopeptidase [Rickettsiales bacterium]|jgi:murein DD-endopeptidase MepM/ murein hydrolase activator NlpD|nr:M23 family metallopeptidase [Rickettsiales bacterium]
MPTKKRIGAHRALALVAAVFCLFSFALGFSGPSDGHYEPAEAGSPIQARPSFALASLLDDLVGKNATAELAIAKGDSFASLLTPLGIDYAEVLEVSKALVGLIKPNELKPGQDKIFVKYRPLINDRAELVRLEIERSPIYKIVAARGEGGFAASEIHVESQAELVRKEGEITKGESLIEVATRAGIPYNIIDKFYEIFSFDVDFERDIYPGDTFSVMYQERHSAKGEYLGSGDLVYASLFLNSRKGEFKLYRFEGANGSAQYFDENGKSASKTLKKTPINGARISSKYGWRKHPVLGYSRAHQGVDFAAPSGTPIPAGGAGTVVFRGWKQGYGNYIKIRHNATYSTAYGHMSSFKSGIGVGSRVQQGQVVGYVGNTGLSTGPHLHYEIIKDGSHVNPLTVKLPPTQKLSEADAARFVVVRDKANVQYAVLDKNFPKMAGMVDWRRLGNTP